MTNMLQKPPGAQWRIKRLFLKNCSTFRFSDGLPESRPSVFHCVAAVRTSPDVFFSFLLLSLFHSEITWTEQATTCWAWPGWLKMCSQRSPTSSSLTWKAGGTNPTRRPLPTRPRDTHTITHRSEARFSAFDWGLTACSCRRALRELSASWFSGTTGSHQEVIVEFPASAKQRSAQHLIVFFFIFMCWFVGFLPEERTRAVQDWWVKSLLLGSDCLTSDLAAGRSTEVMLWFKLVPVCDCFSEYIRTREDRPELARSSLWPIPSGISWRSSPSRITFYIWEYCQDVIEDYRFIG